jgi:hypothetical protein
LRANATTNFGQGIGFVRHFSRFEQIAFGDEFEPVGDEVMYRAFPFAVRIAAAKATIRLLCGSLRVELPVDFLVNVYAHFSLDLAGVLAGNIKELKYVIHAGLPMLAACDDPPRIKNRRCPESSVVLW